MQIIYYKVQGTITDKNKKPLKGYIVKAFDRDIGGENNLGKPVTTDKKGYYSITYKESEFRLTDKERRGPDLFIRVYKGKNLVAETTYKNNCTKDETIDVVVQPKRETDDTYILEGIVRDNSQKSLPNMLVRAFDKDLRSVQLLGKCITGKKGEYSIGYSPDKFCRAEKKSADLFIEVSDSKTPALLVAKSDVLYNAPQKAQIDCLVDFGFSEYERYLAIIEPVREGVELQKMTKEDIVFLEKETEISKEHLEYLVTARKTGFETDIYPEVFYGLYRQGLPTDIAGLLSNEEDTLKKSLLTSINENIISQKFESEIIDILNKLFELRTTSQEIKQQEEKNKLINLGRIVDISEKKMEILVKKAPSLDSVTDNKLNELIKDGIFTKEESKALGLTVGLVKLVDENQILVDVIKKYSSSLFPDNKINRTEELAILRTEEWLELLQNPEIVIPEDYSSREEYAKYLAFKTETVFPNRAFLGRIILRKPENIIASLTIVNPLIIDGKLSFTGKSINQKNLTVKQLEAYYNLKKVVNTYPSLQIESILDDKDTNIKIKEKNILNRINLLSQFRSQNPSVNILQLNYSHKSDDTNKLNFNDFNTDERKMVLDTLRTYQQIYLITNHVDNAEVLLNNGYRTSLAVVKTGLNQLKTNTGFEDEIAGHYYQNACNMVIKSGYSLAKVMDMLNVAGNTVLGHGNSSANDYLKEIDGFEELFGNQSYCNCSHCRSMLSPAAYFVDLMRFTNTHLLKQFNDQTDHPLYLKIRRPDLWKIELTCENTNKRIPYLNIINEVLENYIGKQLDSGISIPLPGRKNERDEIENLVYRELMNTSSSFSQPFSLPLARLQYYLDNFYLSRADIAHVLNSSPKILASAYLNLSIGDEHFEKREYEIISTKNTNHSDLNRFYGLIFNFGSNITWKTFSSSDFDSNTQDLIEVLDISRTDFDDLIATNFVTQNKTVDIQIRGEKRTTESIQNDIERIHGITKNSLDLMHRFVRLCHKLPISVKELDLLILQLDTEGLSNGINSQLLEILPDLMEIKKRFNISVGELCSLWSDIPDENINNNSMLFRIINPVGFPVIDNLSAFDTPFLHPFFRESIPPAPEVDELLHRLVAGMKVTDHNLFLTIRELGSNLDDWREEEKDFSLNHANISLIYRHIRLSEFLELSVPDLFKILNLTDTVTDGTIQSFSDLKEFLAFYDWFVNTSYKPDELLFVKNKNIESVSEIPNPEKLAVELIESIEKKGYLDFKGTVFSLIEGITETQSRQIIKANSFIIPAKGNKFKIAENCNEETVINFDGTGLSAEQIELANSLFSINLRPGAPAFNDDLFTKIENVSKEISQRIINNNPEIFIKVEQPDTFRLNESFNPESDIIIPDSVPLHSTGALELLTKYYPGRIIENILANQLGITENKMSALFELSELNHQDFILDVSESNVSSLSNKIKNLVLPLYILFKDDDYEISDIQLIKENTDIFSFSVEAGVTVDMIRLITLYKTILDINDDFFVDDLAFLLSVFNSENKFYSYEETVTTRETREKTITLLASLFKTENRVISSIHDQIDLPDNPLNALNKLQRCLAISATTGIGGEIFPLIVADNYSDLTKAADALLGAFYANNDNESARDTKIEAFESKIRSFKRDALTDYLIHSHNPRVFRNRNDLYHYFLLDTELEGCAETSLIVAANSSLQLFIHRIMMNLEEDRDGTLRLALDDDLASEWEWRKNYRVWEANRKVFLYPENYLEPDLRDNKTELFKEVEASLLQDDINDDKAVEIYAKYLKGFDELANLKIAGSYFDFNWKNGIHDTLHLFGVTSSDPYTYYYRTIENINLNEYWSVRDIIWGSWQKIDVQIPVDKVSPIVFRNKLYLFWVEISTRSVSEVNDGSSEFKGYKHTIKIKYTSLKQDGTWTAPQTVSLKNQKPFNTVDFGSGEGVVNDYIRNNTNSSPILVVDGNGDTYDSYRDYEENSESEEYQIFGAPNYDSKNIHQDAQEGYTLEGPNWERVYPEVNNKKLNIIGCSTKLISPVNLYSNSIEPYKKQTSSLNKGIIHPAKNGDLVSCNYPTYGLGNNYSFANRAATYNINSDFFNAYGFDTQKIADYDPQFAIGYINNNIAEGNYTIEYDGDTLLLHYSYGDQPYSLRRLSTSLSEKLNIQLFSEGINGLLSFSFQESLEEDEPFLENINNEYVENKVNSGKVDFEGPLGVYYREIFFHLPFLIANHLNSLGKYKQAQKWYHYIFNPEKGKKINSDLTLSERIDDLRKQNWQYFEFRNYRVDIDNLREQLQNSNAIESYRKDPFNPHAIARSRLTAYMKAIFMKYIDNILDWGDQLFSQDTMESINEATMLYILASDLLGDRPFQLSECEDVPLEQRNFENLEELFDIDNPFLIEMTHIIFGSNSASEEPADYTYVPDMHCMNNSGTYSKAIAWKNNSNGTNHNSTIRLMNSTNRAENAFNKIASGSVLEGIHFAGNNWRHTSNSSKNRLVAAGTILDFIEAVKTNPVFCLPFNAKLNDYWDRVEDRLYKIRNCMNIEGIKRELSLFAPEIDPMLLVRARAAGISLEDVLDTLKGSLPPYRFTFIIEKAKSYTSVLQSLGSALLGAIEKRDAEELALIRLEHQENILKLNKKIRKSELDIACETLDSINGKINSVQFRRDYYNGLIDNGLSAGEAMQMTFKIKSNVYSLTAGTLDILASISHLIPELGSPFALKFGGKQLGDSTTSWSKFLRVLGGMNESMATTAGLIAGFKRREEGWEHQRDIMDYELEQLKVQKKIAEIRIEVANRQMEIQEKTMDQLNEIFEFYENKFSNLGKLTWIANSLNQLYKEAYNNAHTIAKLAEQAFRFERDNEAEELLGSSYWNSSKGGLLAGERLMMDLLNMERRYLETNHRKMEVDQVFSISQIDAGALIELKQSGSCAFQINELFFDLFYPGQYKRKIKSVRLTIPCITGPYTNVSARLTMTKSFIRMEPKTGSEYLREVPNSRVVSIATSTAQNDSGIFELNFRDERYMPFEGAGAVSAWELSLPESFRQFDYNTINDVLVHISYTAEYNKSFGDLIEKGTSELESVVLDTLKTSPLSRVFSFRQEFSNEFNRLLRNPAEPVAISISEKHIPFFLQAKSLRLTKAQLVAVTDVGLVETETSEEESGNLTIQINGSSYNLISPESGTNEFGGLPLANLTIASTPESSNVFENGILNEHTISVLYYTGLENTSDSPVPGISNEKLSDILLYVDYTIDS
jgi:hypothetical protein